MPMVWEDFFYRSDAFFTRSKFYAFKRIATVSSMQVRLAGITKGASMANAELYWKE